MCLVSLFTISTYFEFRKVETHSIKAFIFFEQSHFVGTMKLQAGHSYELNAKKLCGKKACILCTSIIYSYAQPNAKITDEADGRMHNNYKINTIALPLPIEFKWLKNRYEFTSIRNAQICHHNFRTVFQTSCYRLQHTDIWMTNSGSPFFFFLLILSHRMKAVNIELLSWQVIDRKFSRRSSSIGILNLLYGENEINCNTKDGSCESNSVALKTSVISN